MYNLQNYNYNFELNWKKIIITIFFFLLFIFFLNNLLFYKWSWILFIRTLLTGIILVLLLYKIIQFYLKKYNIFFHLKIFEKTYRLGLSIYILIDWYLETYNKMDQKYIPKQQLKRKNIIDNLWIKFLVIVFGITYCIDSMFFYSDTLYIIWRIGFILTGFYALFIVYLDIKYIYPNIQEFRKTDILFDGDGPYGGWSPSVWQAMYMGGRYGGTVAKFCYFCTVAALGGNWAYGEFFPDYRTPLARLGDRYNYHIHNIEIPPIDNSHLKKTSKDNKDIFVPFE